MRSPAEYDGIVMKRPGPHIQKGTTMTPPEVFDLGTDDLATRSTLEHLGEAVEQFDTVGD